MQIDRRYRGRRRRSPWPIIILLGIILIPGVYLLATRTRFFENPFNPLAPTATPTRSAVSYLAEAEDAYQAGLFAKAAESYGRMVELEPENHQALNRVAWLWILKGSSRTRGSIGTAGRRNRAGRRESLHPRDGAGLEQRIRRSHQDRAEGR